MTKTPLCELCHVILASVHCPSDAAFLCLPCDAKVHQANFLVARHIRHPLSGESSGEPPSSAHSSSVTEPNKKKRRRELAAEEEIFVKWSRRLGADDGNAVATAASEALVLCVGRLRVSPRRVAITASFWFGLRVCGRGEVTWQEELRRVEEMSGVAGKKILAVEAKLARVLRVGRARGTRDLEEGWGEC